MNVVLQSLVDIFEAENDKNSENNSKASFLLCQVRLNYISTYDLLMMFNKYL